MTESELMRANTLPMTGSASSAAAAAARAPDDGDPAAAAAGARHGPIPLPKLGRAKAAQAVPIHEKVKDRLCAVYQPPIKVDEFVSEEYVILLCQALPPSATRFDIMTLGGKSMTALDPFGAFPDEIDTLPACPPWSSA